MHFDDRDFGARSDLFAEFRHPPRPQCRSTGFDVIDCGGIVGIIPKEGIGSDAVF
jgi:hypothetical protein